MASLNRNPLTELVDDIDYVLHCGSNQPKGLVFKATTVLVAGRLKSLKFQESWYDGRPWLEYIEVNVTTNK